MAARRVPRSSPVSKAEFHELLLDWLASEDGPMVGSGEVDERTPWVHVIDGDRLFILHADTKRSAVTDYLKLALSHGSDLDWTVVPSQKGNMTAVAYGPNQVRIKPFYLYVT